MLCISVERHWRGNARICPELRERAHPIGIFYARFICLMGPSDVIRECRKKGRTALFYIIRKRCLLHQWFIRIPARKTQHSYAPNLMKSSFIRSLWYYFGVLIYFEVFTTSVTSPFNEICVSRKTIMPHYGPFTLVLVFLASDCTNTRVFY